MGRCSTIGGGGATRTTTWAKAALVPSSAVAAAASKNFFIGRSPFLFEASYYIPAKHGLPPKVAIIYAQAMLIRLVATTRVHNIVRALLQHSRQAHLSKRPFLIAHARWFVRLHSPLSSPEDRFGHTRLRSLPGCNSAGESCHRASAQSPRSPRVQVRCPVRPWL